MRYLGNWLLKSVVKYSLGIMVVKMIGRMKVGPVKRSKVKGKGEKERYTHLNAEFQRIARRDKSFLSDQCKEIEENNRMGNPRDLFKKIRDTTGNFHAKTGTMKDRNDMDLTEAED